jgi:hypothetical protein
MSHHEQKLLTGSIAVNPRSYQWVAFTVDPRMKNVRVGGHFQAYGGTRNDIQTVICTEEDFINFRNGHQARVFYDSNKTTVGDINAVLPNVGGRYVLGFNNAFSILSAKTVSGEISLNYDSF